MPSHKPNPLSGQTQMATIPVEMPITYLHFNAGSGKPLLLLFHGYEDTAAGVLRRTLGDPALFSGFEILAPNGLFPVPVRVDGGWKQTHAWYFADFSRRQILVPPQVAASGVSHLIEKMNLQDREKILLGFSQGGFFLPSILPSLKKVKRLIGVAAGYRVEDYPAHLSVAVDAIHGSEDKVISMETARQGFEHLAARNPKGRFFSFEGLGHTMNDVSREFLRDHIQGIVP